jgi:adenine deaminase
METALGRRSADVVFTDGQIVNVFSGEVLPDLWLACKGRRIAYVGAPLDGLIGETTQVVPVPEQFIVPGFVDGHTHLDSIFKASAYATYALPFGNTTAVSEVAMIANAMGAKGVTFFLEDVKNLPMKVFILAPPLVPPSPDLETSRVFPGVFFEDLLDMDRCLGMGETYWNRLLDFEKRALNQYAKTEKKGKRMEGHAAGAKGEKLAAYVAAGTTSCHEAITADEALERLRAGMAVMIREGFVRRELGAVSGIAGADVALSNVMIVTDMADPEELVTAGGMNLLLKKAVASGFDPVTAVQMITINAARYFGLDDVGGLAPGRAADLVVLDDLVDFNCKQVWVDGKLAAVNGRLAADMPSYAYPPEARRSITIPPVHAEDFKIPFSGDRAKIRAVEPVNETITRETACDMIPKQGQLVSDPGEDLLKAAVFCKDRAGSSPGLGFAKGIGLRSGAVATSLIWDTNNILVIGADDEEMEAAVNRLIDLGGGFVVVNGKKVMAELPFPLCGIISEEPLPDVVKGLNGVEEACRRLGSRLSRPFLTFQTFCFTGLPFLRLTDKGLADIRSGKAVSLFL